MQATSIYHYKGVVWLLQFWAHCMETSNHFGISSQCIGFWFQGDWDFSTSDLEIDLDGCLIILGLIMVIWHFSSIVSHVSSPWLHSRACWQHAHHRFASTVRNGHLLWCILQPLKMAAGQPRAQRGCSHFHAHYSHPPPTCSSKSCSRTFIIVEWILFNESLLKLTWVECSWEQWQPRARLQIGFCREFRDYKVQRVPCSKNQYNQSIGWRSKVTGADEMRACRIEHARGPSFAINGRLSQ